MGPRVGGQSAQTSAEPPLVLRLQRTIIRCQAVLDKRNTIAITIKRQIRSQQSRPVTASITHRYRLRSAQRLFKAAIPLNRIWLLEVRSNAVCTEAIEYGRRITYRRGGHPAGECPTTKLLGKETRPIES